MATNRNYVPIFVAVLFLTAGSGCRFAAQNHNANGVNYFQTGQISQSIDQFQKALQRDPNNADAYYNLGSSYYTLAKQSNNAQWMQQAEQFLRQAISLNDRHVAAHRSLAVLLNDTNRQKYAFDLLHTWQRRHPEMVDPLVEIARMHEESGDITKAGEYLADALRIDASDARTLKALGRVRENQGQLALALENYYRSYQRDNRQWDVANKIQELQTRLAGLPAQNLPANTNSGWQYSNGSPPIRY